MVGAQTFERNVAPFPVFDAEGAAFDLPFTGGFNNPRPQLIDIDADGDRDLFIQEQVDRVIFLENTGTARAPQFTWRTGNFESLEVGQWMRFVDADGDGDYDVLAEQPVGYVRYFRNAGTPRQPAFEIAEDTLKRVDGTPIFISAQNTPATADFTCDGRPDLIEGQISGLMAFYAHTGLDEGIPQYELISDNYRNLCFGPPSVCGFRGDAIPTEQVGSARHRLGERGDLQRLDTLLPSSAKHGASALGAGDVDGDGDTDLLWGDFFQNSMYFVENRGGCPRPDFVRAADVFPLENPMMTAGYNAPFPADLDGDGDADLLAGVLIGAGRGSVENMFYFENNADDYELRTRRFIYTVDVGRQSDPAFTDIDGDGDLDLLIGNALAPAGLGRSQIALFVNEGGAGAPAFQLATDALLPLPEGAYNASPALADLDADGDPDLLVGFFDGSLLYFENTGDLAFEQRSIAALGLDEALDVSTNATPAFVDIDGDGDFDLFVGVAGGTILFFRNEGSPQAADFRLVTDRFAGIEVDDARPVFVGPERLLVGDRTGVGIYENTGTPATPHFVEKGSVEVPTTGAAPAVADLNGDGRLEFIVGGRRGGLFFFRQKGAEPPGDEEPSRLLPNRPNPFAGATDIYFHLQEPALVRVAVYDVWGRRVAVLLDGARGEGTQSARFAPSDLASGVYAVIMEVDGRLVGSRAVLYLP